MLRTVRWMTLLLIIAAPASAADKYAIETETAPPPKQLKEPIRELLGEQAVRLLDDKGKVIGEFWFRKEIPAKVSASKLKKGVAYRDLEESTLLGAVRFDREVTDYKKQKIKAGVYTIRLGFQPMDGDHMGTAPYAEFGLLAPAAEDARPGPLENAKALQELSSKAVMGESHPAVFMLVPLKKMPGDAPKLAKTGGDNWVLTVKEDVKSGGERGTLGIGLTVIGQTAS